MSIVTRNCFTGEVTVVPAGGGVTGVMMDPYTGVGYIMPPGYYGAAAAAKPAQDPLHPQAREALEAAKVGARRMVPYAATAGALMANTYVMEDAGNAPILPVDPYVGYGTFGPLTNANVMAVPMQPGWRPTRRF